MIDENLAQWLVNIIGPKDTPYEGGNFKLLIDFSDNFPFKRPKAWFKTKIFHPNISLDTGEICLYDGDDHWLWNPLKNSNHIIEDMIDRLKKPDLYCPFEHETY